MRPNENVQTRISYVSNTAMKTNSRTRK